jgi:ubiquinone/menaquinone biosynthesis C-methylase UbiE
VYTQAISRLPHVEVSHFTEAQLFTSHPPYLPFDSNNFDVVTTRTLYKLLSNPLHSQNPEPASWVRQVHRVLKKGGSFEFLFFDSHLKHAGPLTREMEPFLYEELPPFCTCSSTRTESPCSCSSLAGTSNRNTMTGARFLELLSQEGFVTEKSTTLMFPLTLLSSIFTRDGQRLKDDAQSHHVSMTPLLVSLLKTIDEECKTSQTAWRCIIGYARKQ